MFCPSITDKLSLIKYISSFRTCCVILKPVLQFSVFILQSNLFWHHRWGFYDEMWAYFLVSVYSCILCTSINVRFLGTGGLLWVYKLTAKLRISCIFECLCTFQSLRSSVCWHDLGRLWQWNAKVSRPVFVSVNKKTTVFGRVTYYFAVLFYMYIAELNNVIFAWHCFETITCWCLSIDLVNVIPVWLHNTAS